MKEQPTIKKNSKPFEFVFFGNYFYGFCAVALSIEAMWQQQFPLNSCGYFFLVFISTVLYYTYPYVRKCSFITSNPRTNWYTRNYELIRKTQMSITLVLFVSLLFFFFTYWKGLLTMSWKQWVVIFMFPVVAALYYGNGFIPAKYNLRKIGWLKPFVIGFIWAGLVTVYPVLFYCIVNKQNYELNWIAGLLFLKNLMFIAVLCIMFDIKDYATDYINRLKTFVVGVGLRKTIFNILFPLTIAGLLSFVFYASTHGFQWMRILLNVLPFVLLIMVARSLRKRRSIMFYLVIVDGLMLIKALCGIIAISLF